MHFGLRFDICRLNSAPIEPPPPVISIFFLLIFCVRSFFIGGIFSRPKTSSIFMDFLFSILKLPSAISSIPGMVLTFTGNLLKFFMIKDS